MHVYLTEEERKNAVETLLLSVMKKVEMRDGILIMPSPEPQLHEDSIVIDVDSFKKAAVDAITVMEELKAISNSGWSRDKTIQLYESKAEQKVSTDMMELLLFGNYCTDKLVNIVRTYTSLDNFTSVLLVSISLIELINSVFDIVNFENHEIYMKGAETLFHRFLFLIFLYIVS